MRATCRVGIQNYNHVQNVTTNLQSAHQQGGTGVALQYGWQVDIWCNALVVRRHSQQQGLEFGRCTAGTTTSFRNQF